MIHILLYHWATYVYLVQLLILLVAIWRAGLTPREQPQFMQIAWDRIAAHFAWPLRPRYWQSPDECPEAHRITCDGPVGSSHRIVRLDPDHAL